jgi:casein kinase II subunit beta
MQITESDSISDSGTESLTWISWFCSLPGHEYFAEVSEDFIEDDFNLTGLNALVPFYKEALEMILDVEPQEDSLKIPDVSIVESSAELLYGLIHQRYILTKQGLQQMVSRNERQRPDAGCECLILTSLSLLSPPPQVEKYDAGHFGYCPRVFCHSHPVLPCGRSDLPGLDTVKLFCANCIDCYAPPSSRFHGVDGAFFGTTFPHLLFQCYREIAPSIIAPPGSNANSLNLWSTSARGGETEQVQGTEAASNNDVDLQMGSGATVAETSTSTEQQQTSSSTSNAYGHHSTSSSLQSSALNSSLTGQKEPSARLYTPRIYGFRVSELAKSGPRMRWLRMRPENWQQLKDGVLPRGGGAPERSGTGAVNVGTTTGSGSGSAGSGMGVGEGDESRVSLPGGASAGAGGNRTQLGRPIAGRSG